MNDLDRTFRLVRETCVRQETTNEKYLELYQQLLHESLEREASHIHLHCSEKELFIRYRISGKLSLRAALPTEAAEGLFHAVKVEHHLDTFECRRPQDARTEHLTGSDRRLIWVSLVNASSGPSAVITWEKPDLKCLQLHELGLLPEQESHLTQMLQRRIGFIVVSGRARAGRRTIGHAALLAAKRAGKEAVSLEWGLSRPLPGILQCDFMSESNVSQLQWIQAALRKEPDVTFIEHPGNVDTIGDVIVAAKNSCLVVAAMGRPMEHLIDYLEWRTIPRCASVEALLGVVEQQLVPRVCPNCTTTYEPNEAELRELRIRCEDPSQLLFARGKGCLACNGSGQRGKIGLHEVSVMTEELRTMFLQKKPANAIRQYLLDDGMATFYQSAVHKVVNRQISSLTAIAHLQFFRREQPEWITVDAQTGRTRSGIDGT